MNWKQEKITKQNVEVGDRKVKVCVRARVIVELKREGCGVHWRSIDAVEQPHNSDSRGQDRRAIRHNNLGHEILSMHWGELRKVNINN